MQKIRYAVAGNGWRAMFYLRAAKNLPEWFELTGVLCHTREKAGAFEREHGVKAFWTLDALLETKPDFVVTCVTKKALAAMTMDCLERGMPVLSETPLAVDVPTLAALRDVQAKTGTPLEMAEQYFLYPSHQARHALVEAGLLGQVRSGITATGVWACTTLRAASTTAQSAAATCGFWARAARSSTTRSAGCGRTAGPPGLCWSTRRTRLPARSVQSTSTGGGCTRIPSAGTS